MAFTLGSSASVTSLCKGCTAAAAAAPPPPSLPPAEKFGEALSYSLTLALLGWHWQVLWSHWLCLSCSQAASCSPNSCLGQPQLQVLGSHLVGGRKGCRRLSLLTCHCTPAPPACSRRCSPGAPPRPPPASPSWPRPPCGRR